MKIDIIFGFNATGKTLSYSKLNDDDYVKVSTEDIIKNNSFGYKTDYYNLLINKFEEMIINNFHKAASLELLDFPEVEHYKEEFLKKYSNFLKYSALSKIDEPKSILEKTRLTITGLVNLNKDFQNAIKDKEFSKEQILQAFKKVVSQKIDNWNMKWENARDLVRLEKYKLIEKGIDADENLVKFFKSYNQASLQKLNPFTLQDVKIYTLN